MNCTEKEFIDKVNLAYPSRFFFWSLDISTNYSVCIGLDRVKYGYLNTLMPRPPMQPGIADFIWKNGQVTTDHYGLFTPNPTVLITPFTNSNYGLTAGWLPVNIDLPALPTEQDFKSAVKCECGSWSVGSNKHSSYCPIKDES